MKVSGVPTRHHHIDHKMIKGDNGTVTGEKPQLEIEIDI